MRRFAAICVVVALVIAVAPAPARADDGGVSDARNRAAQAARERADAERRGGELAQQIEELESQQAVVDARVKEIRDSVRNTLVNQYVRSGDNASVLVSDDLTKGVRRQVLLEVVGGQSTESVSEFKALTADRGRREQKLADLKHEEANNAFLLGERQTAVETELAGLEAAQQRRLDEAERQRQAAAKEAAARRAAQAATTGSNSAGSNGSGSNGAGASTSEPAPPIIIGGGGAWVCPVQGPVAFTDDYGEPRPQGWRHQGNDMFAPRGTPVVAVVDGEVLHRSVSVGGRSFFLHGVDGNIYFGTHMDGYEGPDGFVKAGTVIGYVGDDGDARGTGTHLHFEIRTPNGKIDPFETISKYC